MYGRSGDCRACGARVKATGADRASVVAQLSVGEAASAAAGHGADRRRRARKRVDRRGDFHQRVAQPSGAAARVDEVIAGRDEGCTHVLPPDLWGGSSALGMTVKVDDVLDGKSASATGRAGRDLLLLELGVCPSINSW